MPITFLNISSGITPFLKYLSLGSSFKILIYFIITRFTSSKLSCPSAASSRSLLRLAHIYENSSSGISVSKQRIVRFVYAEDINITV